MGLLATSEDGGWGLFFRFYFREGVVGFLLFACLFFCFVSLGELLVLVLFCFSM